MTELKPARVFLSTLDAADFLRYEDELRGRTVVLYDGLCVMCNNTVRLLLRNDPAGRLRFTPIEGRLGVTLLGRYPALFNGKGRPGKPDRASEQSVVVIRGAFTPEETVFIRSDASIAAMRQLRAPWPLAATLLALVPRPLRDVVYRIVARLRYVLFGRFATCPLPTAAEAGRILIA